MWERDEGLMTTSFAIGHSRSLFIQPVTEEGLRTEADDRIKMHALISSATSAVYIGRIDESYIAERPAESPPLNKGDLERLARYDPSVKTAVVVQATDTRSGDSVVSVATPVITDDGGLEWETFHFDHAEGRFIDDAKEVMALLEVMSIPTADSDLRQRLDEMGWTVADSDDASSEAQEE
jgi:hypothetical protein